MKIPKARTAFKYLKDVPPGESHAVKNHLSDKETIKTHCCKEREQSLQEDDRRISDTRC